MFTNKKIVLFVAGVAIIFAAVLIYFMFKSPSQPATTSAPLAVYAVSATEYQGQLSASLTVNGSTTPVSLPNLGMYGNVEFNNTHDIMTLSCPTGYQYSNPFSTTHGQIMNDPVLGPRLVINNEQEANNLTIICTLK